MDIGQMMDYIDEYIKNTNPKKKTSNKKQARQKDFDNF